MRRARLSSIGAFTLVETMISTAVLGIVGVLVFLVLNTAMVLYAKNTAVNSAHQQARAGVDEMLTNIHASVSIPELVGADLQPIAAPGIGPAAGICYQVFNGGPFPVVADASATATAITLYCPGGYTPPAGVRLEIPSHNIELDSTSTSSLGGSKWVFNFASPIGTAIDIAGTGIQGGPGTTYVITAFLTTRASYAVVAGELRYFPTNSLGTYKVISRNIISGTPFTIPTSSNGSLENRYVAAVDLSSVEPNFTQRGYAAVNMFVSSLIPFRCRLTNEQ